MSKRKDLQIHCSLNVLRAFAVNVSLIGYLNLKRVWGEGSLLPYASFQCLYSFSPFAATAWSLQLRWHLDLLARAAADLLQGKTKARVRKLIDSLSPASFLYLPLSLPPSLSSLFLPSRLLIVNHSLALRSHACTNSCCYTLSTTPASA